MLYLTGFYLSFVSRCHYMITADWPPFAFHLKLTTAISYKKALLLQRKPRNATVINYYCVIVVLSSIVAFKTLTFHKVV